MFMWTSHHSKLDQEQDDGKHADGDSESQKPPIEFFDALAELGS